MLETPGAALPTRDKTAHLTLRRGGGSVALTQAAVIGWQCSFVRILDLASSKLRLLNQTGSHQ